MSPARFPLRRATLWLVWAAASWTVAAFFLPWVHLQLRDPALAQALSDESVIGKEVSKFIGRPSRIQIEVRRPGGAISTDLSALAALPPQLTGAQIPAFVREERAQVALAVLEVFEGPQTWARQVAWVYAIPGLAICAAFLVTVLRQPALLGLIAVALWGVVGWAVWRWATTDLSTPALTVRVGAGLWSSGLAYIALAIGTSLEAWQGRAAGA